MALGDSDVYGNTIQYGSDGTTVTYRFWYSNATAEEMSAVGSSSAEFTLPDTFEPRYRTFAASNGKCPVGGLVILLR